MLELPSAGQLDQACSVSERLMSSHAPSTSEGWTKWHAAGPVELNSRAIKWPCVLGLSVCNHENEHQALMEAPNEWPGPDDDKVLGRCRVSLSLATRPNPCEENRNQHAMEEREDKHTVKPAENMCANENLQPEP